MTTSPTPKTPALLTIKEVAAQFGVHGRTVRRWIADGSLRALRLGRSGRLVRIRPDDADRVARRI